MRFPKTTDGAEVYSSPACGCIFATCAVLIWAAVGPYCHMFFTCLHCEFCSDLPMRTDIERLALIGAASAKAVRHLSLWRRQAGGARMEIAWNIKLPGKWNAPGFAQQLYTACNKRRPEVSALCGHFACEAGDKDVNKMLRRGKEG